MIVALLNSVCYTIYNCYMAQNGSERGSGSSNALVSLFRFVEIHFFRLAFILSSEYSSFFTSVPFVIFSISSTGMLVQ